MECRYLKFDLETCILLFSYILRLLRRGRWGIVMPLFLGIMSVCPSCEVLETDISNDKIKLLSPADYAEIRSGKIEFRWEILNGATGYELVVASASFANGAFVSDTIIHADTLGRYSCGCGLDLSEGVYEWYVSGFNSEYVSKTDVRRLLVVPDEPSGE